MKRRFPLLAPLALFALSAFSVRAAIVPGLEAYGDLTLVDEVNCATDTTHEFHEHASNASSVQTILGSPCRVLPHPASNAGFFSYRIGKGKGLVAHDMYLLVVEYPDDVPRTANLLNRAMNSRNGWHTGNSVGETLTAHIIDQTHPESLDVPLSGQYKQLEQVMFLNEKVFPYNTTDSYVDAVQNGFDVIVHVFAQGDALDSAGAAVRAIKLYHVNDESAIQATIKYPTGDVPRRHVTWRDEMGKHNAYSCNADKFDNFRMKMRLMKALGIDTWSRDLFEFGANQYIDVNSNDCGNWYWGTDPDYWTTEIGIYADAGIYLLPYYEYEGGLKGSGLGINANCGGKPLFNGPGGTHANQLVKSSNGASKAAVDISDTGVYTEFRAILDATILRYKNQANFVGAWIRNRGSIGVSFNDATISRFCSDKGYASGSVTRDTLKGGKDWRGICKICQPSQWPAQYAEYRNWWYGKRVDWLVAMQRHLSDNGMPNAKIYYSGIINEPGAVGRDFGVGSWQGLYEDWYSRVAVESASWATSSGYSGGTETIENMAQRYYPNFLNADNITWNDAEYNHAAPHNDPENYKTVSNVALCYPYNCVYTTLPAEAADYRNATDDLFFSRHFCLYEGCGNGVGYFTTEMDRVGRAIMLPELHAMAHQDPTVIGFMQGGHLARNSTKEFREFNENFLSLPAIKGTLVRGGSWSDAVTIRKYSTPAATYYAAINTSGTAQTATCAAPEGPLFATVTGAALPVSGGTATFSLEPYQMLCYTTENPGGTTATAAVSDVTDTTAKVTVTVSALASSSATISVRYSKNADLSGATSLPAASVSAAGTTTFSLSSLSPSTTYYAQVVVNDGAGSPITLSKTFTTAADATLPSGSVSLGTVGPNSAQIAVALASFGRGASRADIRVEYFSSPFGSRTKTFSGVTSLSSTQLLDGLSTKVAYTASVYAKNNLGKETLLGVLSFTTAVRPAGGAAHPDRLPGLWQHKYSCAKNDYPDFTVGAAGYDDSDRVLGPIMADVTGDPGPEVTNPLSGRKYQWANERTFSYEGEMFFQGGVAYNFFHYVDDGVAIELDGEWFTRQSASNVSGYNAGATVASKTYETDGWHPIRIWVYDWSGNKGYCTRAFNPGKGIGWNTNGCTTANADNNANWSTLRDPGDGSLLRVSAGAAYVALDGELSLSGTTLSAPLRYWSYDEDDALSLYWSKAMPAALRDASAWTGSAAVSPLSFPGEKTATGAIANLSVSPGETVYVVARLSNSRAGYESWSEVGEFSVAPLLPPAATLAVGTVGYTDAAFAVNVSSFGTDATSASVLVEVLSGSTVVWSQTKTANATGAVSFSATGLAAGTSYTVRATVTSSAGSATAGPTAFSTTAYGAPAFGDCGAQNVTWNSATLSVALSSLGGGSSSATVAWSLSPSTATPASGTLSFGTTGAKTVSVTGLAAATTYTATLVATGLNGTTASKTFTFRTADLVPPAATLAVGAVGYTDAAFTVNVSSFGTGASSATVLLEVLSGSTVVWNQTKTANATGAVSFSATGLAAGTSYSVRATVTSTAGSVSLGPTSFAMLRFPLALGEPAGICNGTGTEATAKVSVTRADVAATLVLFVDGVATNTWTSVSAGAEYSFSFPIEVGQTKSFEFVLSASGCSPVSKAGSVTGRVVVDWFDVPLDDPAYENWTLATGPDSYDATASWTLPDGDTASAIVSDGAGGRVLSLAPPEGGSVSYEPGSPSEDGRTLEVSGTATLPAREGVPPTPTGTPLAGIALGSANGADALYGYAQGGWTALSGAVVAADATFAWKAVLDFANGTVTYFADGTRLAANGATALPLASSATHATRVVFLGRSRIGSFRGVYAEAGGGAIQLWEAAIRVDGTGLSFTTVGTSEMFAIGLKQARAGAYYVAFAADSLDTPPDDWVCVACSDDPATGGENVDLLCATVDTATGDPIPSQFFKIFGASRKISVGTVFGRLPLQGPGH